MASIIDSIKEIYSDKFSLAKLVLLAVPVYYSYQVYLQSKQDYTFFLMVAGITLFILFGFFTDLINNVISERDYILPRNPFKMIFLGIKGVIALAPVCYISYLSLNYLYALIIPIPVFGFAFMYMFSVIFAGIILTSFVMFSSRGNIFDTYNVKILFKKSGDMIINIMFFLLQLMVINTLIVGFIGYMLWLLFGFGQILTFFITYVLLFNLSIVGHYIGQTNYEVISR